MDPMRADELGMLWSARARMELQSFRPGGVSHVRSVPSYLFIFLIYLLSVLSFRRLEVEQDDHYFHHPARSWGPLLQSRRRSFLIIGWQDLLLPILAARRRRLASGTRDRTACGVGAPGVLWFNSFRVLASLAWLAQPG